MTEFRYRGREIGVEEIGFIRELIAAYPNQSRRTLSKKLCEVWQWRQPNGALRDMVCRGLLLALDRAGQITLPPVSYVRHNPLARRARPAPILMDTTPIEQRLRTLQPVEFAQVRRTPDEPLFNSLMEEHHYLGYEQPVGEHLNTPIVDYAEHRAKTLFFVRVTFGEHKWVILGERRSARLRRSFGGTRTPVLRATSRASLTHIRGIALTSPAA